MQIKEGAFACRPRAWLSIYCFKVEHDRIWWIYWSSLAAWLFLFFHSFAAWLFPFFHSLNIPFLDLICGWAPALIEAVAAVLAVGLVAKIWREYARDEKSKKDELRDAAKGAVEALMEIPLPPAPINDEAWSALRTNPKYQACWKEILKNACKLGGITDDEEANHEKIAKQLRFYLQDARAYYWDRPGGEKPRQLELREAAQLLGLVTEMPPRWIYDVVSERKRPDNSETGRTGCLLRRLWPCK